MLVAHLNAIEYVLLAQSKAAQNAGHPNLRGGPREWFIHEFLESHLPSILEIGQGEIIDENSIPEPSKKEYRAQVDLIIYRRDLPKINYSRNNAAYFAEGVKATIESKSVLTKDDLKQACEASIYHKSLIRSFKSPAGSSPDYIHERRNKMEVDIYKAKKVSGPKSRIFVLMDKGKDINSLPDEITSITGTLIYTKSINMQPGEIRIALNVDEAIKNIQERGYYIPNLTN
ncbi:YcgL-like domain-containing protein [Desulfonema limicola]|uniref:YcgL-like domain-containing protein n=1 Tax=Desulfonema limicola TaxID=45656 RepID=A0A975B7B0_9BACT|nr:DUF6602 domain-containing protein [Desulfonema limicola]QTA79880.1 YcgL-like domain-containing protein [Desulfonema limicola]